MTLQSVKYFGKHTNLPKRRNVSKDNAPENSLFFSTPQRTKNLGQLTLFDSSLPQFKESPPLEVVELNEQDRLRFGVGYCACVKFCTLRRMMGRQSRLKAETRLADSVDEKIKSLYQKLYNLEVVEVLLDAWESKRNFGDDPVQNFRFQTSSGMNIPASKIYDIIWAIVDTDWHLWELTQVTEPLLKKSWKRKTGNPYPFDNAVELFLQTIEERTTYERSQRDRALEGRGYFSQSPRNWEKFMHEAEKALTWQLSPSKKRQIEQSALKRLSRCTSVNMSELAMEANCPHYYLLLATATKARNETVKRRLKGWQYSCIECFRLQKPLLHKLKNLSLNNGKIQGDFIEISHCT